MRRLIAALFHRYAAKAQCWACAPNSKAPLCPSCGRAVSHQYAVESQPGYSAAPPR
jgi:predicted amidophosphoribosyltransferase